MTDSTVTPTNKPETKVTWATIGALVAGLAIALLNATQGNSAILGGLPPTVQFLFLSVIPTLVTFAGGYLAPHTSR